jgi:hypothetical protein
MIRTSISQGCEYRSHNLRYKHTQPSAVCIRYRTIRAGCDSQPSGGTAVVAPPAFRGHSVCCAHSVSLLLTQHTDRASRLSDIYVPPRSQVPAGAPQEPSVRKHTRASPRAAVSFTTRSTIIANLYQSIYNTGSGPLQPCRRSRHQAPVATLFYNHRSRSGQTTMRRLHKVPFWTPCCGLHLKLHPW